MGLAVKERAIQDLLSHFPHSFTPILFPRFFSFKRSFGFKRNGGIKITGRKNGKEMGKIKELR